MNHVFGYTKSGMLGLVIFMALAFASYWVTLPSVIPLKEVDGIPVVGEMIHYILFMIAVMIIIPFIMKQLVKVKFISKAAAGAAGAAGPVSSSFGRRR